MTPGASALDRADVRLADPQGFGYRLLGHVGLRSNPQHVCFGELGSGHSLAPEMTPPLHHVPVVVGVIAGTEVRGVDADGSVARVQDMTARRAVENLIGDTVGFVLPVLPGADPGIETSVAIGVEGSSPVPAPFGGRVTRHEPAESIFRVKSARSIGTTFRPAPQGVTVLLPPDVVGVAQTARMDGMRTS